ncbi:MAG TPA: response regulator [Chitinophagaceae bacterium]|nr:response regulator [Chitinophagaceae bacterium]
MDAEYKLLLLEDNPDDAALIGKLLERSGMKFSSILASDEKEFLKAIGENQFDAVLADNALPQYSSMEALNLIKKKNPDTAFILVTGTVSEEFAVNIIKQGADDYILKTNLTRLSAAINKAVEKKRIKKEKETAEKNIEKEKELSDSIINSLPAIFYFCDAKGNFLRCNNNFENVSGYSYEEINKMLLENFFEPKKEHVHKWIEKVFTRGYAETEAMFKTRSGEKIPYYFTGSAVRFEDELCLIGIGMDISARKQAEKEMQQLNSELRRLSAHLQNVREEEQTRIAREIHDELGQQITGLKMDLNWLKKKLTSNTEPMAMQEKISSMNELLDKTIQTIRKIASELRPSILDDLGLYAALEWQSQEFEKRFNIPVQFSTEVNQLEIAPAVASGLFRIYQESLTNVARHAEAKKIVASLQLKDKNLVLTVTDDGKGFVANDDKKTLGLLGMKERALTMGGKIEIKSEPGKGTTVIITVSPEEK